MKKWLILWTLAVFFIACSEEDFHPSILDAEEEVLTEVDQWIMENYTGPHNIEIIYRWDDFETDPSYQLVPPDEEKVIPFLKVIRKVWIEPYIEMKGNPFFNKLCPKQVMLIGSAGYADDGTFLLGQTEAGNKIAIFNLNLEDPTDELRVLDFAHIFHHEFSHLMHQTVEYPEAFKEISVNEYTADWSTMSAEDAGRRGFISPYAAESADEDFAELVAYYLHYDPDKWEQGMRNNPIIKAKATIMINYMKSVWGIDMPVLRDKVRKAINDVKLGNF